MVLESTDDLEFYLTINYAANTLQNGHTYLVSPATFRNYCSIYSSMKGWKSVFNVDA
ncbi:MAG: hypothetical protein WCS44_04250 [Bacillota bacterium]|nr:hypothetical protein [Bacillota bacterium]